MSGDVRGGTLISENGLQRDLNMSRTPIRNALKILEAEGFVHIAPKQGVVVRELTAKLHMDVYELRMVLEEYVLRLILPSLNQSDIDFLCKSLDEQRDARDQGDIQRLLESDIKMHMFFIERYGNETIKGIMLNLRQRVYQSALTALSKPGRMDSTLDEHQMLIDAIAKRDVELAIQILRSHLKKGCSLLPLNICNAITEERGIRHADERNDRRTMRGDTSG